MGFLTEPGYPLLENLLPGELRLVLHIDLRGV